MGLIDVKKIETIVLANIGFQKNKTDPIDEFFGFGNWKIRTL